MLSFEAYQRDRFCAEICQALQTRYPNLKRVCSNNDLVQAVNQCLLNGQSMGFDARSEIAHYTLLCFQFGISFIDDPLLPWATETLRYAPVERIHYLGSGAKAYAKSVLGINHRLLNAALGCWIAADTIAPPLDTEELRMLYPKKADYAGSKTLDAFLHTSNTFIQDYAIVEPAIRNEIIRCAFIFGCRIHQDPFAPAIRQLVHSKLRESTPQWIDRLKALALDLYWARRPSSMTERT